MKSPAIKHPLTAPGQLWQACAGNQAGACVPMLSASIAA